MSATTLAILVAFLSLLCLYHDAIAPYTAPIDNKHAYYLKTSPAETFVGLASDWPFCETKCADDSVCIVFSWSSYRKSCKLYPPEMAYTTGVQEFWGTTMGSVGANPDTNVLGRIDRSSDELVWLSLGLPRAAQAAYTSGATAAECQAKCDTDNRLLPCAFTQIYTSKTPNECILGTGFPDSQNEWKDELSMRQTTTKVNPVVDPTGNGTRITASNLPPAPPNTTSIPFTLTNITTKSLISSDPITYIAYTTMTGGNTWEDCAEKCRDNAACRSFQWDENGKDDPICKLYDIAVIGTIIIGRAPYGVIDKDAGSNAVDYLVPSFAALSVVVLSSFESVTSLEECAAKCYHFYQPIYCTSFQLDHDASRCVLYPFNIEYWTPSSVSLPVQGNVQMGIINGRKPYNHHYDYGMPVRQLITTTTSTTTTTTTTTTKAVQTPITKVVVYTENQGQRNDTTAAMEVLINTKMDTAIDFKRLHCSMACFNERAWCKGYDVDIVNHVCRLYDTTITDSASQLADDQNNFYGNQ